MFMFCLYLCIVIFHLPCCAVIGMAPSLDRDLWCAHILRYFHLELSAAF